MNVSLTKEREAHKNESYTIALSQQIQESIALGRDQIANGESMSLEESQEDVYATLFKNQS